MDQTLFQIIRDYPEALSDRKKLNALLQDSFPQEKLVRNTLLMVFDEGIIEELKTIKQMDNLTFHRYKKNLVDGYGISDSLAEQAIELWINALEISLNRSSSASQENRSDAAPVDVPLVNVPFDTNEAGSGDEDLFDYDIINQQGDIIINQYIGFDDKEIHIPNKINGGKVCQIRDKALQGCSEIITVSISDGMESIGDSAFENCTNLQNIFLPSTLKTLGKNALKGCKSLHEIIFPDSLEHIGEGCLDETGIEALVLPPKLQHLESDAFCNCEHLKEVICPDDLSEIPEFAFTYCVMLGKITFPKNLLYIGSGAFSFCNLLREIIIPDGTIQIGGKTPSSSLLYASGDVFPSSLERIYIPDSVVNISQDTFTSTSAQKRLTIYCHPGSYAQRYAREHNIKCARA